MRQRSYKSEGIVLGRQNVGEADRILHVFSRDFGKITLIARGVRKLSSRKRGHTEIFTKMKFSAVGGKGLDIITEAEQIDSYSEIRKNLKKVALTYYFSEIIGRLMHEGDVNTDVYIIFERYLNYLKEENKLKPLRIKFLRDIIVATGYWPEDKPVKNPDLLLEDITQKKPNSLRVGKRILS